MIPPTGGDAEKTVKKEVKKKKSKENQSSSGKIEGKETSLVTSVGNI